MKNLSLVLIMVLLIVFSSCESRSGRRVKPVSKVEVIDQTKVADTTFVTPDKVGVSNMINKFTPYPDCDGGECVSVEFIIAVQISEALYQVKLSEMSFTREKGKAKEDNRIVTATLIHSLVTKIPAKEVLVALVNHEVVKISTKEIWGTGGYFTPPEVLWQKKKW